MFRAIGCADCAVGLTIGALFCDGIIVITGLAIVSVDDAISA